MPAQVTALLISRAEKKNPYKKCQNAVQTNEPSLCATQEIKSPTCHTVLLLERYLFLLQSLVCLQYSKQVC